MEAATQPSDRRDDAGGVLESFSPTTDELVGTVPLTSGADVQAIVDDVASVQPFWAALPLGDRARYMRRTAQVVIDALDELGELISREQGKPRNEALTMELLSTVDALHWIADAGPGLLADERVGHPQPYLKHKRSHNSFEPLGVVGVISPWNYPWSIPFGEIAIALMAGNGVVLKPAPLTPLIGDRIQATFERAGLPPGLVRVIHGEAEPAQALVESSTAKIFFTGSVAVGRRVGVACAEQLKGSVLELGGKDPMLVLADADVPNAVAGALWGGFANAGQTCAGIERVYVQREIAERFVAGLVEGARSLRIGDPLSWETEVGPMVSRDQYEIVKDLVEDAGDAGAEIHCGGPVELDAHPGAAFFAPTVITGVTHEMRIMREEIFGPVLAVMTVDSEEDAIRLANESQFGLGASVWTTDRDKGARIARRLEAGMVWVNDHMYTHAACQCPWGGVKESGLGRAHSRFGFYECVEVKLVDSGPARMRAIWWHPYDASLGRALHSLVQLLYGRDADKRGALKQGKGPIARLARKALGDTLRR
ncbi:MAG: aldehyde dehydrogenase family protein [Thermoleophilaceae bacterium]